MLLRNLDIAGMIAIWHAPNSNRVPVIVFPVKMLSKSDLTHIVHSLGLPVVGK